MSTDHGVVTEEAVAEIIAACLAPRIGEEYLEPGQVHIEEFGVSEVKTTTIVVSVACDVYAQDGISAGVTLELDRWEPCSLSRARLIAIDD